MEFDREETPTIMDGLVVRWYGKVGWSNKPEISASRNGVVIYGAWPTLSSQASLDAVKAKLDEALQVHQQLARECYGRVAS